MFEKMKSGLWLPGKPSSTSFNRQVVGPCFGVASKVLLLMALGGGFSDVQGQEMTPETPVPAVDGGGDRMGSFEQRMLEEMRNLTEQLNSEQLLREAEREQWDTDRESWKSEREGFEKDQEAIKIELERTNKLLAELKADGEPGPWDWAERYDIALGIFVSLVGGLALFKFFWDRYWRRYPILSVILNAPCEYADKQALAGVPVEERVVLYDPSSSEGPVDYTRALWTFSVDMQELEDINTHDQRRLAKAVSSGRWRDHTHQLPTARLQKLFAARRGSGVLPFEGDMTSDDWLAERAKGFLPLHKDTAFLLRRIISIAYGDDAKELEKELEAFDPNVDRRRLYIALRDDQNPERKHLRAVVLPHDRLRYIPELEEVEKCWVRSGKLRRGRLIDLILMKESILEAQKSGDMDVQPYIWAYDIASGGALCNVKHEGNPD